MKTMKQIESNKRSFIKSLLWFCMYYLFFCSFCIDVLGLPSAVSYGIDFILLFILFFSPYIQEDIRFLGTILYDFSDVDWYPFCLNAGGLFVVYGSPLLYLWGLRNIFRYYIPCLGLLDLFGFDRYPPDAVLF